MLSVPDLKALLIHAAYTGAVAVCEPLINEPGAATPIPVDPLIQDAGLQAKGLLVYEEAKVQYAAILKAFEDQTGIWPNPVLPAGTGAQSTAAQTNSQATGAGQTSQQALNKFAQAVAGVAQVVEPMVPGADLVANALNTVVSQPLTTNVNPSLAQPATANASSR
jgi:hypothetical protein